jgi:hypothetical protein
MVTATIENDVLNLRLSPLHKLLAFKGSLEIPLEAIDRVERAAEIARSGPRGSRNRGTRIPYLLYAGSFRSAASRTFWDVRNPENAISIWIKDTMFAGSDEGFDQIIVEVSNPAETVGEIERALARAS